LVRGFLREGRLGIYQGAKGPKGWHMSEILKGEELSRMDDQLRWTSEDVVVPSPSGGLGRGARAMLSEENR